LLLLNGVISKITILLVVALVIREVLAPFTGHPFDFELWIRLGYYTAQGLDPYRITGPIPNLSMPGAGYMPSLGYPPVWPFILAGLFKLYAMIDINNRFLYYFILKQPMIIGDLLDSVLIYKILSQKSEERALKGLAFWLFCPFTILISAVWGMFDQIVLAFVLLSILWFTRTKTTAVAEAVGILLKLIPLIYLPLLALVQKTRLKIVQYLVISIVVSIVFTLLPYLIFPSWHIGALLGTGSSDANKVGNSMNYWVIIYIFSSLGDFPSWAGPIINTVAYAWIPVVIIASFFCIRILRAKRSLDQRNLVLSMIFVTLAFYLTRIQINEQYTVYFLGLGLIDYYWLGSTKRMKEFHGVWISALAYLVAHNSIFIFLAPISKYYSNLYQILVPKELTLAMMFITASSFSIFCALYLRSIYFELSRSVSEVVIN